MAHGFLLYGPFASPVPVRLTNTPHLLACWPRSGCLGILHESCLSILRHAGTGPWSPPGRHDRQPPADRSTKAGWAESPALFWLGGLRRRASPGSGCSLMGLATDETHRRLAGLSLSHTRHPRAGPGSEPHFRWGFFMRYSPPLPAGAPSSPLCPTPLERPLKPDQPKRCVTAPCRVGPVLERPVLTLVVSLLCDGWPDQPSGTAGGKPATDRADQGQCAANYPGGGAAGWSRAVTSPLERQLNGLEATRNDPFHPARPTELDHPDL